MFIIGFTRVIVGFILYFNVISSTPLFKVNQIIQQVNNNPKHTWKVRHIFELPNLRMVFR